MSVLSPSVAHRIAVSGYQIEAREGETLLQAAERAGIAWPSGCRVGACGTCRCRVNSGEVHERTESAYLLDADEIAAGTVLACQTEALSDLSLTLDAPLSKAARHTATVTAVRSLSPHITELSLRCDTPIDFHAGQFAQLCLPEDAKGPAIRRPYSFSTAKAVDGSLRFTIRHHPGGAFSEALNQRVQVGTRMDVDGPYGQFAWPAGELPVLMLGAGTGFAPLLAMLEAVVDTPHSARDVVLLVAAKQRADLYGSARLAQVQSRWRGSLRVVPVLSTPEDDWLGERGRLTERLPELLAGMDVAAMEACLCGPAGFVDAAEAALLSQGMLPSRVHADRFVPAAIAEPVASTAPDAGPSSLLHTLKFSLFHAVGLGSALSMLAGGAWTIAGLIGVIAVYVIGDLLLGDDLSVPDYRHPAWLTAVVWSALPMVALISFIAVWRVSPGDPLAFGAFVQSISGIDVLAARDASGFGSLLALWLLTGLMIGMASTVPAHELVHRTWDPRSMRIGRGLLAFSFDTSFAIEHVHGHHRAVATRDDPASAPRGRSVYAHVLHSTWFGNLSAWRIEVARLSKRGVRAWHPSNKVLQGWVLTAGLVALAGIAGGWVAALFFCACALLGKSLLEIVNYMEHYGLARDPSTPVQPRHSWNTNRRISSWTMFNLTRHSHHHAQGEVPFHLLRPMNDAPMMPTGYLGTLLLTLVPPLWKRMMAPRLADWDARFATPAERHLARQTET